MDKFAKSTSGQVHYYVHKWTDHPKGCSEIWTSSLSPQVDEFITKSTSGQVHYDVLKWTNSLRSPQVDEFITKFLSGRIHYEIHKWTSSLRSPQMDEFITKSFSGQIQYKVHKWTSLILNPQKEVQSGQGHAYRLLSTNRQVTKYYVDGSFLKCIKS